MIWVALHAQPMRQFYRDPAALVLLSALEAQHRRLRSVTLLREAAEDESANLAIEFDNRDRRFQVWFADPPLGAAVTVYRATVARFEGVVARVVLAGDVARLEVDA